MFRFTFQEVGSIIGKKGEIVKRFREEVRIRVRAHGHVEQGRVQSGRTERAYGA